MFWKGIVGAQTNWGPTEIFVCEFPAFPTKRGRVASTDPGGR